MDPGVRRLFKTIRRNTTSDTYNAYSCKFSRMLLKTADSVQAETPFCHFDSTFQRSKHTKFIMVIDKQNAASQCLGQLLGDI